MSVIADGAKWIWDRAAKRFESPHVDWVVDVYHATLYLHAAAAALGTDPAERWVGARVVELIELGGPQFIVRLNATGPPDPSPKTAEAWAKLLGVPRRQPRQPLVRQAPRRGLPIGSGLIEGGGKSTLARRLKINSARWRIRRAERMGAIRCLQYSDLWAAYWDSRPLAA